MIKRHVSAEEIARFGEGDVGRRKAARISSHLAGCSRCTKIRDDLAMVPALLARTAAPPMPDHLAARIQTALITESARRASPEAGAAGPAGTDIAAGPSSAAGTGAGSAGSARPKRHAAGWSWPRIPGLSAPATGWVAAAAAAVLIAGGGSYLVATGTGSSPGHNSSASSSSSASSGSAAGAPRAVAGANAPVAPVQRGLGPQLSYQRAGQQSKFTPITTATNYVPGKLESQVKGTLTAYQKATATSGTPAGKVVPHATPDLKAAQGGQPSRIGPFPAGALEGCVTRISAGTLVLLVDVANFQGSPAAVIVTEPAARGPEHVSVVGTGCSASRSDVLTRTTLPAGG